jgi:type I restriction enzyme R subunit
LIALAKSLRDQPDDGLTPEEAAFYDALAKNKSAVELLGNDELLVIAAELVKTVCEKSSVDWWWRENVRSAMRVAVRRILKKHGFPPDLQAEAVKLVIQQAEAMAFEIRRAA